MLKNVLPSVCVAPAPCIEKKNTVTCRTSTPVSCLRGRYVTPNTARNETSARNYESRNVLTQHARRRGGDACGVLARHRASAATVQVEVQAHPHKASSTSYVGVPLLRPELQEMVANVARPRRASAAARPMTRRVLAEGRTPRRASQVVRLTRAAVQHAVPHQQWVPPLRRPAAPRWLRGCGRGWGRWGWGGWGGGILASCPPRHLHGMDNDARRAQRKIQNSGFKAGHDAFYRNLFRATAKLLEIVSSLIFAKNSSRKFQTHISNSG